MSDVDELLYTIENLRDRLHALIKQKELSDPEVLVVSQQLDQALNKHSSVVKAHSECLKRILADCGE